MIWSSADIPREVAAPQSVPRTPFFLRSTHRCLLAEPVRAMAVVVDALIAMDCDISMESPEPSVSTRPGPVNACLGLCEGAPRAGARSDRQRAGRRRNCKRPAPAPAFRWNSRNFQL